MITSTAVGHRNPTDILANLDQLRDRRYAHVITEDDYHIEEYRLWDELRKADRMDRALREREEQQHQREVRQLAQEHHERRPKVYCDGCCEPGESLGIGVYSKDCGIEINFQIAQPGTSNVAECLGVITALKECKKRGITGIRLLSDSQLVVNWATGRYAQKSQTAQLYVPIIHELLSEVRASIEWIPGSQNLADKYSRNQHLFPDNLSPLEKLKTIPPDHLSFRDFVGVKSGWDNFSRMGKERIIQLLEADDWEKIGAAFVKKNFQLSAARWRLRGLPVEVAIRKVEVDREIGKTIAVKRQRIEWDD
jgi:ribonuclease HI